jgi:hypothetical protein
LYSIKVDDQRDMSLAKECLATLDGVFPGYPWHIYIGGGVLQIKNLTFSRKWGMVRKLKNINSDAMTRKRDIIASAGEFLERANLRRGAATGERAVRVEGIPQKDFGR